MLWNVQMNRRQKASLICILGLGVFATAAALVKVTYQKNYGRSGDWLWDSRNLTIWTVAECNVGIVAGNLPCLKPIFRTILGSTYGRGSRKTPSNYYSRPYGPGTNRRSSKPYASLGSNKTQDGEFKSFPGKGGDTYMLTTIDANKEKLSSGRNSTDQSFPERESTEDIIRSDRKAASHSWGAIEVTTHVDVRESHSPKELDDDGFRLQRPVAKDMV